MNFLCKNPGFPGLKHSETVLEMSSASKLCVFKTLIDLVEPYAAEIDQALKFE